VTTHYSVEDLAPAETGGIADVIATAFTDLAIAQWQVPDDPIARWHCLYTQFVLQVEYAFTVGARVQGIRDDRGRLVAVAVWMPPTPLDAPAGPEDYDTKLREITGRHYKRFRTLDAVFAAHTPDDPHTHLMFLASVLRDRGLGTLLLETYLTEHDRLPDPQPVCLDASCLAAVRLYLRHGFTAGAPVEIPNSDGLSIYPMRRDPAPHVDLRHTTPRTPQHRPRPASDRPFS
jgi:GNAT superfamily N-acetyltransferase